MTEYILQLNSGFHNCLIQREGVNWKLTFCCSALSLTESGQERAPRRLASEMYFIALLSFFPPLENPINAAISKDKLLRGRRVLYNCSFSICSKTQAYKSPYKHTHTQTQTFTHSFTHALFYFHSQTHTFSTSMNSQNLVEVSSVVEEIWLRARSFRYSCRVRVAIAANFSDLRAAISPLMAVGRGESGWINRR